MVREEELIKHGVKVVIYANHLLRSAYPVMIRTAKDILKYGRALEAEKKCLSVKEVIRLIPNIS
jgi:2-methylisocitrate lyase-like PEP mutase family enzyme